ncbi:transporter [Verrucomicrobia bacterium]|jgi:hypothetical protein|nr:transporter [Verrucomicrobiota bacterium]
MMGRIAQGCLLFLAMAMGPRLAADEPIMNMMPRWSGGWGYQFVHEYRHESDLLLGRTKKYPGFTEDVHLLHMQGVYTWDKSIRLTAKLPYVLDAHREMPDGSGGKKVEYDNGIGDLTLALPLKKYFNLDGESGSWTLKPMLRVPFSGSDEYEVYDNQWGNGLGVGYEYETANFHFHISTSGWVYHGNDPFESFSSLDLGYNFYLGESNCALMWETDFHWEDDESRTLSAGPAFYWNINDTAHLRLEWKHDFYDRQGTLDHGNGDTFKFGIGFVY